MSRRYGADTKLKGKSNILKYDFGSGSKLFDTLKVFLREFFKKVDFKKKIGVFLKIRFF